MRVNIKNTDDKCFKWCLTATKIYDDINSKDKNESYHHKKHTNLIKRPNDITCPITTDDIYKYEELNNIQINVFLLDGYDEETKDIRNYKKIFIVYSLPRQIENQNIFLRID